VREPGRTADPSAALGMTKKARRVLWYPTQAETGLEWGTEPLLMVKQSKKVTASTTASWGRQDDDSVGVVMKNTLTKLALMGPGPLFSFSTTPWMNKP
jgi:hypothetical protein